MKHHADRIECVREESGGWLASERFGQQAIALGLVVDSVLAGDRDDVVRRARGYGAVDPGHVHKWHDMEARTPSPQAIQESPTFARRHRSSRQRAVTDIECGVSGRSLPHLFNQRVVAFAK